MKNTTTNGEAFSFTTTVTPNIEGYTGVASGTTPISTISIPSAQIVDEDYERYKKAINLDEKQTAIRRAFYNELSPGWEWWITDILDSHVIVTDGAGMFWAYPYFFTGVKVGFGDPVEVERRYIFSEESEEMEAKATEGDPGDAFADVPNQEGVGDGQGFANPKEEVAHLKSLVIGQGGGNVLRKIESKSTSDEIRVGNYMLLWGTEDATDLEREFFEDDTNWESDYTKSVGRIPMDWEHGRGHQDANGPEGRITTPGRDDILGYADMKTAEIDENGLWVERVLNRHNRYMSSLSILLDAGILGTSTEPVQKGVKKAANGKITDWPLVRDSLTVTPVEWRMSELGGNVVGAMKAIADMDPIFKEMCEAKGIVLEDLQDDKGEAMGLSRQKALLRAKVAKASMKL